MPSALSHGAFFLLGCPEGTGDTPGLGGAAGSTGGPEARRPQRSRPGRPRVAAGGLRFLPKAFMTPSPPALRGL